MDIQINTYADGGHVSVNIKVQGQTLLSLADNESGGVNLYPGITYRFEWFAITAHDAHIKVDAIVTPPNTGFPPLMIDKTYPPGVQDGNVFLFTLN